MVMRMFSQSENLSSEFPMSRKERRTIMGRCLFSLFFILSWVMSRFFPRQAIRYSTRKIVIVILLKLILLETSPGSNPSATRAAAKVKSSSAKKSCRSLYAINMVSLSIVIFLNFIPHYNFKWLSAKRIHMIIMLIFFYNVICLI